MVVCGIVYEVFLQKRSGERRGVSFENDKGYDSSAKHDFFFENGNMNVWTYAPLVEFVCLYEISDDRVFGSLVEISAHTHVVPKIHCVYLFIMFVLFVFVAGCRRCSA